MCYVFDVQEKKCDLKVMSLCAKLREKSVVLDSLCQLYTSLNHLRRGNLKKMPP